MLQSLLPPQAYAEMKVEKLRRQAASQNLNNRTPFSFRGNNARIQAYLDAPRPAEWLLEGPAETGKTLASLNLVDALARKFPRARGTIVRKWRADMNSTVLDVFKRAFVEPAGDVRVFGGEEPQFYNYPNGSRVWVAGIDRQGKVLSGALDFVYFNQAEEAEPADWELLGTRTTGRAGVIVPGVLFGDMNPAGLRHFLYAREAAGDVAIYQTTHRDNPRLFDEQGEPTAQGLEALARLSKLTGMRRVRLFEGKRATPEGAIYGEFNRALHVKPRDPQDFQYWVLALDAGFDHPAVILLIGVDADLRLHVAAEFYQSGVLPSRHANLTFNWSQRYHAGLTVVDPSAAGLIAELANLQLNVRPPKLRDVERGIELVHELLAVRADRQPGLTVDPGCVNTINEFESYARKKGVIVKENDHALDALRYFVAFAFGDEVETREVIYDPVQIGRW